jgi:gamma-glutamyltranspeptidase/glutathione hydrolase
MTAFLKKHQTPFELEDFSEYFARVEEPATVNYRGYQVYKHAFGSQGPVLLQALNILERFDLQSMKRNSAAYLHTVVEALKLAYADRDTYYADPEFVQVPGEGLLSKEYARLRAQQIDPKRASRGFIAGNPLLHDGSTGWRTFLMAPSSCCRARRVPMPSRFAADSRTRRTLP